MLIVLVSCTSFFFFHGGGGGGEGGFYCSVQEMTRWTGYEFFTSSIKGKVIFVLEHKHEMIQDYFVRQNFDFILIRVNFI